MLCGACSTGEEVFSFALALEKLRHFYHGFDYSIVGFDSDPLKVKKAQRSIYEFTGGYQEIPEDYQRFTLLGSGRTQGFFTLTQGLRERCNFKVGDLADFQPGPPKSEKVDAVVYRNAMIGFHPEHAKKITQNLLRHINSEGLLILGLAEDFIVKDLKLKNLGQTCFIRPPEKSAQESEASSRVLIIDDSPVDRTVLKRKFEKHGLEVHAVDSAGAATKYLENFKTDLITLDLHMPGQMGQQWLSEQRQKGLKTPVVIISSANSSEAQKVLDALDSGAQDYFNKDDLRKNSSEIAERLETIISEFNRLGKRSASGSGSAKITNTFQQPDLILIGASTGGTEILVKVLENWPIDSPPVVVVQHIAHQFATVFYERLGQASGLKTVEPKDKMVLKRSHLYMSTGDYHIGIAENDGEYILRMGTAMSYGVHRPSVDHLFKSACRVKGNITAALLTGMGKDGARGLSELHRRGAFTYAQDEASCVVYGMPKEAIELGAARSIGNPDFIRRGIIASLMVLKK